MTVIIGAHTTLRMVRLSERKSFWTSARLGSPKPLRTAPGSDTARANTSRTALWVASSANAARQSATKRSTSNIGTSHRTEQNEEPDPRILLLTEVRNGSDPEELGLSIMSPLHPPKSGHGADMPDRPLRAKRRHPLSCERFT